MLFRALVRSRLAVMGGTDVIRTPDQRLRVFVSSTLQELAAERRAVLEAVTRLRLVPVMIYVKSAAPDRDSRLTEMLARIRDEGGVSYQHFSDPAELGQLARQR